MTKENLEEYYRSKVDNLYKMINSNNKLLNQLKTKSNDRYKSSQVIRFFFFVWMLIITIYILLNIPS